MLVKPSETVVGKVYRVAETTYTAKGSKGYSIYKGCLVRVTSKNTVSCFAVPIDGSCHFPMGCAYINHWNGVDELFEGPIEENTSVNNINLSSKCSSCGTEGQMIALAWECPNCWLVW